MYITPSDFFWSLQDIEFDYECPWHGGYRRRESTMLKFRARASKAGIGNRTRISRSETKVAKCLRSLRISYEHNARMGPFLNGNGRKIYYWLDFYLRNEKIDIECSPSMWHSIWGHSDKDVMRKARLEQCGIAVLTLGDSQLRSKHTLRTALIDGLRECCGRPGKSSSQFVNLFNLEGIENEEID
jgi:hypothetical protein